MRMRGIMNARSVKIFGFIPWTEKFDSKFDRYDRNDVSGTLKLKAHPETEYYYIKH